MASKNLAKEQAECNASLRALTVTVKITRTVLAGKYADKEYLTQLLVREVEGLGWAAAGEIRFTVSEPKSDEATQ